MNRRNMTQKDLEKLTGIDQAEISRIINEKKEVTLTTAKKISTALGYSIDYIWPD